MITENFEISWDISKFRHKRIQFSGISRNQPYSVILHVWSGGVCPDILDVASNLLCKLCKPLITSEGIPVGLPIYCENICK